MPGKAQPLFPNIKIANPDGTPTIEFIRWAQVRQNDIVNSTDDGDVEAAIAKAFAGRKVATTAPLAGGGALSSDLDLSLTDSGVDAGSYGDAGHSVTITIDVFGRITAAQSVPIVPEAPEDGKFYCRQNGAWVAVNVQAA